MNASTVAVPALIAVTLPFLSTVAMSGFCDIHMGVSFASVGIKFAVSFSVPPTCSVRRVLSSQIPFAGIVASVSLVGALDDAGTLCGALDDAGTLCGALDEADTLCGALDDAGKLCGALDEAGTLCGALDDADTLCGALDDAGTLCDALDDAVTLCGALDEAGTLCGALDDAGTLCGADAGAEASGTAGALCGTAIPLSGDVTVNGSSAKAVGTMVNTIQSAKNNEIPLFNMILPPKKIFGLCFPLD